ncbi:MAG: putative basic amino acid antiporter YfcC [Xanthomonadales bacterium]|nr:putative basic amino acid antiporter YfcC [Xanthomonadales bacterium]
MSEPQALGRATALARRTPDTLIILLLLALLCAAATWFVPAGRFTEVIPALDGGKQVRVVLHSYERVETTSPIGLFESGGGLGLLNLPFEGLVAGDKFGTSVGLVAFLLVLGGSFNLILRTGAIDRLILGFVVRYQSRAWLLIPGLFLLFSLGGAIFGMGEETIPMILLLVPILARLGFNATVVVLVSYVATQIGFATSWMNPFSVVVAQGVAGLEPLSGAPFRVAMWGIFTLIGGALTLRYALGPGRLPTTDMPAATHVGTLPTEAPPVTADWSDVGVGLALLLGIGWVVWGVTTKGYYLPELAAQFLAIGLVAATLGMLRSRERMHANDCADAFREGAAIMLPIVLVVALAKGLVLLLGGTDPTQPSVMNTLLYGLAGLVEGWPPLLSAWLMLLVQSVINFFVTSGSGQAALTMPILAPLGDLVGVSRQVTVLAFQLGDGLTNLIVPTSAILMGVLGAARIDWWDWARFFARWMAGMLGLASLFVVVAVLMGY